MKKHYRKNWEGKRVFAGYKVTSLYELALEGYYISSMVSEDYYDYRKKGVVYINEEFNWLLYEGKYMFNVFSRDSYILDWDKYVEGLRSEKRSVLKNGIISR